MKVWLYYGQTPGWLDRPEERDLVAAWAYSPDYNDLERARKERPGFYRYHIKAIEAKTKEEV